MNRAKKPAHCMLVFIMCATLFVGCTQAEMEPEVEDKLTISMLYSDNANYPIQEEWMAIREIESRLNMDLQLETISEPNFTSQRTIRIHSGEMPDIITKTLASDISSYTDSGLFLPISDYMDQMPHFTAFVEAYDYWDELDIIKEYDGKFYMLPVNANTRRVTYHGWLARVDLFEAYGIELPTTMEEVYEASKVYKEHNPDAYPMTNRFGMNNILFKIAPAFGTRAGWGLGSMFHYDEATDSFIFAPATEGYKEMLVWMHKMYSEGLLDVEFSTLDATVYEERAKKGEQFIMIDWIGNEVRYNKEGPEMSGDPDFNIQPIMPPVGPEGLYSGASVPKYEQGWVINAKVAEREDFEEVLAFLDWFYSEEAAELLTFGIEGQTFEVLEDGRKEYLDPNNVDYSKVYGINNNVLTVRRDRDHFASNKSEEVIQLFDLMEEKGVFDQQQPSLRMDEGHKEEAAVYGVGLNAYVTRMTEAFIYGKESLDDWDTFIEGCNAKGVPELYQLYNEAWKAQNPKKDTN